jgi:hypothetical protein
MTSRLPVFGLLSLLAAGACGGQSAAATPTPVVNFTMASQNGSTVLGTGQILESTGSFTVTLKLTGMSSGSNHVSHIHAGKCSAPGGVVYALQSVIADASGAATTISTIPAAYAIPASGWYVNVHHGPDFTQPGYAPSDSCGNLAPR